MQTVFDVTGPIALTGWVILVFTPLLPRWAFWLPMYVIPGALCITYAGLASIFVSGTEGNFDSLSGVMRLFDNEQAAMAGWLHYLAFDLFVASWQVQQAKKQGMRFLLVLPALPVTLYFGPVGLMLFFILSACHRLLTNRRNRNV